MRILFLLQNEHYYKKKQTLLEAGNCSYMHTFSILVLSDLSPTDQPWIAGDSIGRPSTKLTQSARYRTWPTLWMTCFMVLRLKLLIVRSHTTWQVEVNVVGKKMISTPAQGASAAGRLRSGLRRPSVWWLLLLLEMVTPLLVYLDHQGLRKAGIRFRLLTDEIPSPDQLEGKLDHFHSSKY